MGLTKNDPSSSPSTLRPTRARFVFLGYAGALSLVLYLDRICIAKSGQYIAKELSLDKFMLSCVFSAFTIGYTLFEIPSGAWGDRYGPKRVLCRIVLWWSLFTVLTGCIWSFALDSGLRIPLPFRDWELPLVFNAFVLLLIVRFLFGVGEAGAFPNLAKCSSHWFPLQERGFAQGIVATAGRLGGSISAQATLTVTFLVNAYLWQDMGWRVSFWLFGGLGVVWVFFFAAWFRNSPADHSSVNEAELALITGNRTRAASTEHDGHAPGAPWRKMLTSVNLWAYSAMAFCSTFVSYLYFTHFPGYLTERHQVPEKWSGISGLPMLGGAIGCTLGGLLTDWLVRRTGSKRWGRRTMGLVGKGCGAVLLFAGASMDHAGAAIALITLSAFASDLALASQWAISTDTGGRFVGTVFGVMNMVAGIGGIACALVAGAIIEAVSPTGAGGTYDPIARKHAWNIVLYLFAATLALGALCWLRIDAEESVVD